MINHLQGWVKIYLFYGGIFFLLGLSGYLASHEAKWERWFAERYNNISVFFSGLFRQEGRVEEVTVTADRYRQIVFLNYSTGRLNNSLFTSTLNKMQALLQTHYRSIIPVSVGNSNNLDQVYEELKLQSTPWILAGYNRTRIPGPDIFPEFHHQLFLSLPEESLKPVSSRIIASFMEVLPNLIIKKRVGDHLRVMEFVWSDFGDSDYPEKDLLDAFLEILDTEIFKMTKSKPF